MSEQIKELTDEVEHIENDTSKEYDEQVTQEETTKKKISKKKLTIIVAISVVAVLILAIVLIPSKFERIENKCVQIAGQAGTGKNYFSLDTDPYEGMDEGMRALLLPDTQTNTLEAIRYANNELGFPGSVYSDMLKTSAMMGRQSEENNKYKVSWTYHPDHGLEVTYTKK